MFEIGFWELILIAIVGLLVLGPERLPLAIRNVSRWIGAARKMAGSVRDELEQELKIQELKENLKKAESVGMKNLAPDLQDSIDELKKAAQEVQRPYSSDKSQDSNATNPSSLFKE